MTLVVFIVIGCEKGIKIKYIYWWNSNNVGSAYSKNKCFLKLYAKIFKFLNKLYLLRYI